MKLEGNNTKVTFTDDSGKVTEITHLTEASFKLNKPMPKTDGFLKVGVCSVTGTVKINKWNMFKLRFFMRKVYFITWFKSKFNKNLKVEVNND